MSQAYSDFSMNQVFMDHRVVHFCIPQSQHQVALCDHEGWARLTG